MSKGWRIAIVVVVSVAVVVGGATVAFVALGGWTWLRGNQAVVVPEQYRAAIKSAARTCPAVPASVLAAQIAAESGWDPRAVSPAGAKGIAQFMPDVWEQYGVDGDGDGKADILNPIDAIYSAAALNCVNRDLVADVPGDKVSNILAAYNAGFNMVIKYDGVPPFPETRAYVDKILQRSKNVVM